MLKEKIDYLFNELNLSVGEIAGYAKTDVTNISRIKSGARTPKPSSATVDKLINGIIEYCQKNGKTDMLDELISYDGENRKEDIRSFLFEDYNEDIQNISLFSGKLNAIMNICGISNEALAKRISIDSSYLSRIRNGKRTPKANSNIYEDISRELFDEIKAQNKLGTLKKHIISEEETDTAHFYADFCNWLCNSSISDTNIKSLIESISQIELAAEFPFDISQADFLYEEKSCYFGISGIQEAGIRFLNEVINSEAKEILLYSDRNIDWMTEGEFAIKWSYLMHRLVSKGVRIKIIHNIDRRIPDMVSAIKSWLPIYMSCQIEPYYTNAKAGKRFNHTLFVCPGVACVKAFNLPDDENADYDYFTDEEHIKKSEEVFKLMLEKSLPLIFTQKGVVQNETIIYKGDEFNSIEISMGNFSVTVARLNEPQVSFTVLNSMLVNAIKSFCASYEAQNK